MDKPIQIGIVGYGKMGHMVERMILDRKHEVAFIANSSEDEWGDADVIIEFSQPTAALSNIRRALNAGIPIVTGTTGWHESRKEIEYEVIHREGSLLHSTNFSIGVNLFFAINEYVASLFSKHETYESHISETHHTEKKDSPSGTAITLAEGLLKNHKTYDHWAVEKPVVHPNYR